MRAWLWQLLGRLVPDDLFDVDLGDVDEPDLAAQVREALAQLDGTSAARISLLTGFSMAELDELGGLD